MFRKAGYGSGHFRDQYVFRYNRTGDDILRQITTVDTSNGRATVAGGVYSNTTDNDYELWGTDPLEINESIITAQRKYRYKTLVALSGGRVRGTVQSAPRDFDMEASGVAWWDGTSGNSAATNITPTKSTTDLFSGTQALLLTATGASGTIRGERLSCQPAKTFYAAAIVRADVGTLGFNFYDATNSAVFSSPGQVTTTSEEWVLVEGLFQTPTGCEEMHPYFTLSGATDIGYVDCIFGPYFDGARLLGLPSWLDEGYELKALRPARYRTTIASRTYDAFSREFYDDWVLGQGRFEMEHLQRDVSPVRLQLYQELPREPIWISAERDLYAGGETLATESSTTTADLDMLIALTMEDWIENKALPRIDAPAMRAKLGALLAEYKAQINIEEIVRPSLPRKERVVRKAWVA